MVGLGSGSGQHCNAITMLWGVTPIYAVTAPKWRHLPAITMLWRHLPAIPMLCQHLPAIPMLWRHLPAIPMLWRHLPAITAYFVSTK